MPPPGAGPAPIAILSEAGMRAAEAAWFAAGHDSFALMQVAAAAVARRAMAMLAAPSRILVLAGPGNNGGDAHVAAALLAAAGHRVEVVQAVPPAALGGDAARAAALWTGRCLPPSEAVPEDYRLIIDGLFGIGLERPVAGELADLVRRCNGSGVPILAIDIPSGVQADSGAILGEAIAATVTVTFHAPKPGHFLYPGRGACGRLDVADIGLPPTAADCWLNMPALWRAAFPVPDADAHKYARGGVLVWSGPELAGGAARLAARAALRVGAGAVTLCGDRAALRIHAAQVGAIMLAELDAEGFARRMAGPKVAAACIGPGAGIGAARKVAEAALGAGKPLVLDADALTAFAGEAEMLGTLVRGANRAVVLTPHAGEFARLFPDLSGSRLERARAAAAATGAVVILKGPDTVVAAADGTAAINANAPPWLATAGSGDTLAGLVTGLLAQGMPGFAAGAAAVWLHGAAGTALGPGLTADDLAGAEMRAVLAEIVADRSVATGGPLA